MLTIFEEKRHGTRTVKATDAPGSGNAHHHYIILHETEDGKVGGTLGGVSFQRGPILESGVNGIHNEDLLHIVRHRLECFQTSQFACEENAKALSFVKEALEVLASRTLRRVAAGVEGTHKGT